MKKVMSILLVLFMVLALFGLVACGGGGAEEEEPSGASEVNASEEPLQEETPEVVRDAVTASYVGVTFLVPADATLVGGGEDAEVGSTFMIIYDLPGSDQRATATLASTEIDESLLEGLGADGLLEALVSGGGELIELFGRDVVVNPNGTGGYQYWFFNDAVSIAYLLTIGDAEADSAAAGFFTQIIDTLSVSG